MKEIHIEVRTPSKLAFDDNAYSVTVPGTKGNFQVLYNHAPILSSLEIGKIKIVDKSNKKHVYATGGGTIEVLNNNILILVESFEPAEEIDVDRAKKAMERAKERLTHKTKDLDVIRAELAMKRALNRLKIAGR